MKTLVAVALLFFSIGITCLAQTTAEEKEVVQLSLDKWKWMSEKDIPKLKNLFHPDAKFVHMSGTWKTPRELEIIETGSIWYKKATIHDTDVELLGNTAIVWNRITLESLVRGNDAKVEFTVTEAYIKEGADWKLIAFTFSSVRDTHEIEH